MNITERLSLVRSALFLPASNPRAIAKARTLVCDMAILDLEDAVRNTDKAEARDAAIVAIAEDWQAGVVGIRINGPGTPWHEYDVEELAKAKPAAIIVPKVESAQEAVVIAEATGVPLLAMIETPAGVYAARDIAAVPEVVGLIAGTNDLANTLGLPPESGRSGLTLALQAIVLAARAGGAIALDGVYNRLDDPEGLAAVCREGRTFGFDGKTLIHPNQIDICNQSFGPGAAEIEEAQELIAAATGGAERFRDRMIETMHVESAQRLLARAHM